MTFNQLWRRLWYLLNRRRFERDLEREMATHRAMMTEPRRFGNTLQLRERSAEMWGWRWFDELTADLRSGARQLVHAPGFAITAILTLALGIGANIGMFTLVNALLLRPLFDRPDEVVGVYSRDTTAPGRYPGVSYPNYLDLREGATDLFSNLAAEYIEVVGLDAGEGARRTLASGVTSNYFQIFRGPLARGRSFTRDEERLGEASRVAVISYSLWQQRGADPNVLGRLVRINGDPFTVVGVAAEGFTGTGIPGPDVWMPLGAGARRDAHNLTVVGRLRSGRSIESVAPALATISRRLEQAFPDINKGLTFVMDAPSRLLFMPGPSSGFMRTMLAGILMLMPAVVLLVACLNLADLLLARGHVRRQELAIRSSLGGGRWRLTRQLLTAGLLLSLAGGVGGVLLSMWATGALVASLGPVIPIGLNLPEFNVDWRVLTGTMGFSLMATLVFGAWPAWALTGGAVVTDLKRHAGGEGKQPGGIRLGNALVVAQVALSLLLLASGGLFLMSAISAATADPGFRLDGGVLVEIDPSLVGYDDARARVASRARGSSAHGSGR